MVDVIACTVFGSRSGSLDNWAMNIRDPLSIAVYDFPKRGIMVSALPSMFAESGTQFAAPSGA